MPHWMLTEFCSLMASTVSTEMSKLLQSLIVSLRKNLRGHPERIVFSLRYKRTSTLGRIRVPISKGIFTLTTRLRYFGIPTSLVRESRQMIPSLISGILELTRVSFFE
jgi:hypothetical protein